MPRRTRGEGELTLVRTVLTDAIRCIAGDTGRGVRHVRAEEARAWIASRALDWPFAFENVCLWLDLDPARLRARLLRSSPPALPPGRHVPLTPRERAVLRLVLRGLRNGEVATVLGLARPTVVMHLGHVFAKLGVRSRAELRRTDTGRTDRAPRP